MRTRSPVLSLSNNNDSPWVRPRHRPLLTPDSNKCRAITAKVKSALIAEPGLKCTGIEVVTEKGVVSLFGTAVSHANRERATRVAADVEGVRVVENNLAILQGS